MTTEMYILLGLLALSMPAAMTETLLLFLVWPPYITRLGRPTSIDGLPAQVQLGDVQDNAELKFRPHNHALLFRRTFGFGRGRPMYAGVIRQEADGTLSVRVGAAPLGIPIVVAFGAFGGLTFGGGSVIAGLVFGALFAVVLRYNRSAALKVFSESGASALRDALR